MDHCAVCGTPAERDATFCAACGARLMDTPRAAVSTLIADLPKRPSVAPRPARPPTAPDRRKDTP